MLPLPPFRFIRKHHNYTNYKNINYFLCHIYVTRLQKNRLTPIKDTCTLHKFVKLLQAFMSPPPTPPHFLIFSQMKNFG